MQKNGRATEDQPAPTGTMAWVGFGLCVFALACLCISFCSPYWYQAWPMSQNEFRNIGLWHVCFYNYMQFKDDSQQVYSGCWWLFDTAPKYYKLREWLIPPWFISCQVMVTGCLMIEIAVAFITGLIFLHFCPIMNHEYLQTYGIFAAGSMMFLVTMVALVVAILFGVNVNDRYWLPRPDLCLLSWGFGFLIISGICALASGICLFKAAWDTYTELIRREDEYTKQALQMSTFVMDQAYPTEEEFAVVQPGYSGDKPDFGPSYERTSRPPSYSSQVPPRALEPRERPEDVSFEKPPLETSMERPPPAAVLPITEEPPAFGGFGRSFEQPPPGAFGRSFEQPPPGAFGRSFEQPQPGAYGPTSYDQRDSGAFGKSYEQPMTYGKSYDRSFERHYSDTSFNDPEQEELRPSKPERQY